ncbi:MAG TPA: ATP-binding protein [Terricaulis sp.]|nr:ATP-binding protein [Terricaulis sp.]HRP09644.1 ATP-binding protein [Terricaulis sp.]
MRADHNPYNPGAGVPPPELAGRDDLLEQARVAIVRARGGRQAKSAIMLGLRGVGKTVLLNALEAIAEDNNCQTALIEIDPEKTLAQQLAPQLQHILHRLDRVKKAGADLQKAFGSLRAFAAMFKASVGDIDFSLAGTPATGDLAIDLTDLFLAIADAAKKRDSAIVLLIDEIQYLQKGDLSALIMAMHKISQRQLPLLLFGAGLPQLAKLAGDAKSYAERLFDYPPIGPLDEKSARLALAAPAEREGVKYAKDALDYVVEQTGRYPFFLQVWGAHCWEAAEKSPISLADAKQASAAATSALDEGIFKVRLARLTERQRAYARAMAEFGPEPVNSSDVANALKLTLSQAAPIRDELIKKGMAYSPERGLIGFTVPKFDEFMRRALPAKAKR